MGCTQGGGSKGKEGPKDRRYGSHLHFEWTKMRSMDNLLDSTKELLEQFDKCAEPVENALADFYDATLYYEVPCATVSQVLQGVILSLSALV